MLGVGFDLFLHQDLQRVLNKFRLPAVGTGKSSCGALAQLPSGAVAGLGIFAEVRLLIVLHAHKVIIGFIVFLRVGGAVVPVLPFGIAALGGTVLGGFVTAGPFARFDGRSGLFLGGGFWFDADFVE